MDIISLHQLLSSVAAGKTSVEEAATSLARLPFENIDYARIDHHRSLRKGFPEVIFGQGKTAEQIAGIIEKMRVQENVILATRVDAEKAESVTARIPDAEYHPDARMLILTQGEIPKRGRGKILILSAGTSDIPVAREAQLTAEAMGNQVETIFDVGVAGIHRLLHYQKQIEEATVPSVVAGMVSRPVIAVPTSIGYGVSFGGLTALFAMLNSCSSNVAVVNIDNGFGAGYMAAMINKT